MKGNKGEPAAVPALASGKGPGRPPHEAPAPIADDLDHARIDNAMAVMREGELAAREAATQRDARMRAVAAQLGYSLPADATDPDLILRDINVNLRRSVEACLEVGRALAVLKAGCEHGQFMDRVEKTGMSYKLASRFMQAAIKFGNVAAPRLLAAAGSQSKLFELLVLDDDQLEELELTGQTGGLTLDDVDCKTQKELRAAVRELQKEVEAAREVSRRNHERADKAESALVHFQKLPPDEQLAELQKAFTTVMNEIVVSIRGQLRQAVIGLQHRGDRRGEQGHFIAGMLAQAQAELNNLRQEFGIVDLAGDDEPEFSKYLNSKQA
jgi:hypothetical protein